VLTVSVMLASCSDHPLDLAMDMQGVRAFAQPAPGAEACAGILRESEKDIASLRQALGDCKRPGNPRPGR